MSRIKISNDLLLPVDVVTQVIAILAKRRAGKSYTMRRVVEQLFDAGQQIVLIDPKGDQWGLRSSADGKSAGKPILILGGEHGDLPLEAAAGELIARLVVEERVSVLLDLSLFRKNQVAHFMTDFLENLYRLKAQEKYRTPLMLVVDEADAIAPQKPQANEARMLGSIEDIVRRGGQRGIGCTLVSQRSAVLNKNVLTQAQVLVVLRTIAPQDIAAMKAWIEVHGTLEQGRTLIESLPALPVGDAWFWSPGWPTNDGIFKRVRVLPIETFDSGDTPKPGQKRVMPKTLADVDLDALKGHMADTIEKQKANDPALLRKRIAELEKQLSVGNTAPSVQELQKHRAEIAKHYTPIIEQQKREINRLNSIVVSVAKLVSGTAATVATPQPDPVSKIKQHIIQSDINKAARRNAVSTQTPSMLPTGEQKVLAALIQYPNGLERNQLTVLTGFKRSTRDAYIQRLSEKQYVGKVGSKIIASEEGKAALPDFEPLPTGRELQEYWREKLPDGEWKILEVLIHAYPNTRDRETLSEITEFKRSTRDAYIQRLASKELIETVGRGEVKASETLF